MFVGLFGALVLAWLVETGLALLLFGAIALAVGWIAVRCDGVNRRLKAVKQGREYFRQSFEGRIELADRLFEVAIQYDDLGQLAEVVPSFAEEAPLYAASILMVDRLSREAIAILEEQPDFRDLPVYLQLKQQVNNARDRLHRECKSFNEVAKVYNSSLEESPISCLKRRLTYPAAPTIALSERQVLETLDEFDSAESPLLRDLLSGLGWLLMRWRPGDRPQSVELES